MLVNTLKARHSYNKLLVGKLNLERVDLDNILVTFLLFVVGNSYLPLPTFLDRLDLMVLGHEEVIISCYFTYS
jgi:hypothetical protein